MKQKKEDREKESFDEYKIKRENDRIKLHARYLVCIFGGVVIWLITTGTSTDEKFPEWISFASTITSIILSVIAIIMSITGESKTDAMRNQMEETSAKLERTAKAIEKANQENKENIEDLKNNINILQHKIEQMPEQMSEVIEKYEKSRNTKNEIMSKINNEMIWVNKNGK